MIPPIDDLDALFKRLHLANARRVWRDLVRPRRAGDVVLPRLPRAPRRRGDRPPPADPPGAALAHGRASPSSRPSTTSTSPTSPRCGSTDARLVPRRRLRHRGSLADPSRQARPREDAPRRRHRLSRHSERLRRLLHHRRRRSSTTSPPRFAPGGSREPSPPTPIPPSWSSTRSATSPTAPTPPTCSSTSSTNDTGAGAR